MRRANPAEGGHFIIDDSKKNEQGNIEDALPMKDIVDTFYRLNCRHQLIILDCCFAGSIRFSRNSGGYNQKKKLYRDEYNQYIKHNAKVIITSTSSEQEAKDLGENKKNSPFTDVLIELLKNNEQAVIDYQIEFHLIEAMRMRGLNQSPKKIHLKDDGEGRYIFLPKGYDENRLEPRPKASKEQLIRGVKSITLKEKDDIFFVRQKVNEKLLVKDFYKKVKDESLIVVTGKRGIGKSSLINAGLIPELKNLNKNEKKLTWVVLQMSPSEFSFNEELNNTLTKERVPDLSVRQKYLFKRDHFCFARIIRWRKENPISNLLLVIDQCEDLFEANDNSEWKEFLDGLAKVIVNPKYQKWLRIVLIMGTEAGLRMKDHFQNGANTPDWEKSIINIEPMEREELRNIIESSNRDRFYFAMGLENQILDELPIREPQAVLLLCFTLEQLYLNYFKHKNERHNDQILTKDDYKFIGGVEGVISKKANFVYDKLVFTKELENLNLDNLKNKFDEFKQKTESIYEKYNSEVKSKTEEKLVNQEPSDVTNLSSNEIDRNEIEDTSRKELNTLFADIKTLKEEIIFMWQNYEDTVKKEYTKDKSKIDLEKLTTFKSEINKLYQDIEQIRQHFLHKNLSNVKRKELNIPVFTDSELLKLKEKYYVPLEIKSQKYKENIRNIMLRMVRELDSDKRLVSRIVDGSELDYSIEENKRVATVIREFERESLLIKKTSADNNYEIKPSSYILIQNWEKVNEWLNECLKNNNLEEKDKGDHLKKRWSFYDDAVAWKKERLDEQDLQVCVKKYAAILDSRDNWLNKLESDFFEYLLSLKTVIQYDSLSKTVIQSDEDQKRRNKLNNISSAIVSSAITMLVFLSCSRFIFDPNPIGQNRIKTDTAALKQNGEISGGEKIITYTDPLAWEKLAGVQAIKNGDFPKAITKMEKYLKEKPNDPEVLIYLNNAKISKQKSYTIAVSTPIGSDINSALEILRGVAQAQDEINKQGGINGIPLRVLIADDNDDKDTAKKIAEELVKNLDVLGVVGHFSSDVTLETDKIYNAGKLVAIFPISTSTKLTGFGNYIFRTAPNDSEAAKSLVGYMRSKLGKKNAAVFYNSKSASSESLKSEFEKFISKQGGQVSSLFDLSDSNFNADNSIEQSIKSGAEILVLLPNTGKLDDTLQVVKANKGLPLLGGNDIYTPKVLEEGKDNAVGMVLAIPWHILVSPNNFPQNSRKLWKADVNWRTAMSYNATVALIEGLKNTPTPPTREGLAQILRSLDFRAMGATGEVKFDAKGDSNQAIQLVEIRPNAKSRSKSGYDFEPE